MKKIAIIFLMLIAFSCNNKENKETTTEIKKTLNKNEIIEKDFKVKLNYKSNQSDKFSFSLKKIKVNEFQTKKTIIDVATSVTTSMDEIVANFGDNISNIMTIDFGRKNTKSILLESITLSYGKYSLIIQPSDLEKYFRLNDYVSLDTETNTLITKKINGKLLPIISLKQNAINLLKKAKK